MRRRPQCAAHGCGRLARAFVEQDLTLAGPSHYYWVVHGLPVGPEQRDRPWENSDRDRAMRGHTIYRNGEHHWLAFTDEPAGSTTLLDANRLVVRSGDETMLLDPGGEETFPPFLAALVAEVALQSIRHVFISRYDRDVDASLALWRRLGEGDLKLYLPRMWSALDPGLDADGLTPIPDQGMSVELPNGVQLRVLPAHYLYASANFHVYDPAARVLFSGDVGSAPAAPERRGGLFVEDFAAHVRNMSDFHRRWMPSSEARDAWIRQVSALDVDVMAPRAGALFKREDVDRFLDWFSGLDLASGLTAMAVAQPARAPREAVPQRPKPRRRVTMRPLAPKPPQATPATAAAEPAAAPAKPSPPTLTAAEMRTEPEPSAAAPRPAEAPAADPMAALHQEPPTEVATPSWWPARIPRGQTYRLITRSDFDGLVCAVLLEELELIDDIKFVHPKDMQDGNVPVSETDLSTNLPYVPGIGFAFDHHLSETRRLDELSLNHVIDPTAPSAARVVYDFFGGKEAFPRVSPEMMAAVDKADSAQFTMEEALDPKGWVLLNFIMDSRTGLGRYRGFRVPNYELMMSLIDYCREHTIDEILQLEDVKERVALYMQQQGSFMEQIRRCSTVHQNLVVLDLREEDAIHVGNRFMIYALFARCNISMHVMWGMQKQNTVFAVGKSIFDRSSRTNVGDLMLDFGGGGHLAAGTCQVATDEAEDVKEALIDRITIDG